MSTDSRHPPYRNNKNRILVIIAIFFWIIYIFTYISGNGKSEAQMNRK